MLLHVMLLLYKLSCTVHGEGTQNRIGLEIPDTGEYEDDNKPSMNAAFFEAKMLSLLCPCTVYISSAIKNRFLSSELQYDTHFPLV